MLEIVIVFVALIFLAIGVALFLRTFMGVWDQFPAAFKEGLASTSLVDTYVWDRLVPDRLRRWYFAYLGSITVAGGLFTGLFALRHELVPTVLFAAVSTIGLCVTALRWFGHRRRM
jgi:hypothetical protein